MAIPANVCSDPERLRGPGRISPMNSGRDGNLQSEYGFNSLWAERVAKLIIVGLVVEIAAVFILRKPFLEGVLTIVSNVLIVAGVWGERILEKRAKRAGDGIVAEANARAFEAQAALEKFKAPRRLSPEQRARIGEKLKQYAGRQFVGSIAPGVEDARNLWRQIAGALREANWTPPPSVVGEAFPAGLSAMSRTGVHVLYWVGAFVSSPSIQVHAEALASALNDEGIDALAWPAHGSSVEATPNAIRIEIGFKP